MKKQKIFVISVGRSDYDRYFPIIKELNSSKKTKLYIVATKSHFDPEFGKTIKFIDKKFRILKNKYENKRNNDLTLSFGQDLIFLNKQIRKHKPDKIIVLGDRYEMLIGPIGALPYNIPVIHFYGGAVTLGATDELVRHAITKMSHYHFVLLPDYKKRVLQLGEEKWRVKSIGMHELNYLKNVDLLKKEDLNKIFKFDFNKPFILTTFHPVTLELKKIKFYLQSLFKAIKDSKLNTVITYPNADPKHKEIINFIKKNFTEKNKYLVIKNCGKNFYSSLLKYSSFLLGNSSSGIVEAATFKIPAVNVGTRQDGKYKPLNVIDSGYSKKQILKAINLAKSKKFKKKLRKMKNPYESSINVKEVASFIINIKNTDRTLRKKFNNFK